MMLNGHYPPIYIMDGAIGKLVQCEYVQLTRMRRDMRLFDVFRKLSLSTNLIEKIANLNGLSKQKPPIRLVIPYETV